MIVRTEKENTWFWLCKLFLLITEVSALLRLLLRQEIDKNSSSCNLQNQASELA